MAHPCFEFVVADASAGARLRAELRRWLLEARINGVTGDEMTSAVGEAFYAVRSYRPRRRWQTHDQGQERRADDARCLIGIYEDDLRESGEPYYTGISPFAEDGQKDKYAYPSSANAST